MTSNRIINGLKTPEQIKYGFNSVESIQKYVEKNGFGKAAIITDRQLEQIGAIDKLYEELDDADISKIVDNRVTTEPKVEMVRKIKNRLQRSSFDFVIGIGGGSCMDAAKLAAVVAEDDIPIRDTFGLHNIQKSGKPTVLIPTTAGTGSEVTNAAVITDTEDRGDKKPVYSDHLFADLTIVDPQFTSTMPASVAANTGADALTHAIEAYVSKYRSPITDLLSKRAIELIGQSIDEAVNGESREARRDMINAAMMAGIGFANSSVGAVHALTYPISVEAKIAHGKSNAVLLPYVMEYNIPSETTRFAEIADALGADINESESLGDAAKKSVKKVIEINNRIGLPTSLKELDSIERNKFDTYADIAMKNSGYNIERNPRDIDKRGIVDLFEDSYAGNIPYI